jgi:hypothetical protein
MAETYCTAFENGGEPNVAATVFGRRLLTAPFERETHAKAQVQPPGFMVTTAAEMGERRAVDRGGVRRVAADGPIPDRTTAGPGGPSSDLALPRLGTFREPKSREY